MKIGSFNIRGLGDSVKKEEIHSFFSKFKLDFCCVQEMKLETFNDRVGWGLWKSKRCGLVCRGGYGKIWGAIILLG